MRITFIKGSRCFEHVRVSKFIEYFLLRGWDVAAFCWKRDNSELNINEEALFSGGGYGGKKLILYYPFWIFRVFLFFAFYKPKVDELIFAVDFDTSLPIFLAKKINPKLKYIYDIHDEFAIRYNFPVCIKQLIKKIDRLVRDSSELTIHVDDIRVSSGDKNYMVIYNSPSDFYTKPEAMPSTENKKYTFCISGLLNSGRGMDSLYKLAIDSDFNFIVAGEVIDKSARDFVALENVNYLGYIPQSELFESIKSCCAVFSLYDPSIEINRLAASNKLYDAMMLGIPVITNSGLKMADVVDKLDCGYIVPFDYDESWLSILNVSNENYQRKGKNGRVEYLERFSYHSNFTEKLDTFFERFYKNGKVNVL